jgi:hypothetical protein
MNAVIVLREVMGIVALGRIPTDLICQRGLLCFYECKDKNNGRL